MTNNKTNRPTSSATRWLLLTMLALLGFTQGAWATNGTLSGSGTSGDPYIISDAADWATFVNNVNSGINADKYYKLGDNISGVTTTVGAENKPFSGTFDGDGHTLNISYSGSTSCAAPFSYVSGATITNLKVTGTNTSTGYHSSGLVGSAGTGNLTISNCEVSVAVSGAQYNGGFVGHGNHSTIAISNSVFNGSVSATNNTAPFVGWKESDCSVAYNNCLSAPSSVSGTNFAFTHEGNGKNVNSTFTNCYYLGTVSFGTAQGNPVYTSVQSGSINRVLTFSGTNYYQPNAVSINGLQAYYDYNNGNAIDLGEYALTDGDYTLQPTTDYTVTITNSNSETVAAMTEKGTYTLTFTGAGNYSGSQSVNVQVIANLTGSGTVESPYLINDAADWTTFANNVAAGNSYSGQHVRLNDNISGVTTMVGTSGHPFRGTFDGNGKTLTVSYTTIATPTGNDDKGMAPFRFTDGATIKNLTVAGTITTPNGTGDLSIGGIVGRSIGSAVTNITNCTSSVNFDFSAQTTERDFTAGGIIGCTFQQGAVIDGCLFNGKMTGSKAKNNGGIVGWSDKPTTIRNTLQAGTFSTSTSGCGTFSRNAAAQVTIENSYYLNEYGSENNTYKSGSHARVYTSAQSGSINKVLSLFGGTYYQPNAVSVNNLTTTYVYAGGSDIVPSGYTVKDGSTTLTETTDYTVTITDSGSQTVQAITGTGAYTVTFTGTGTNYVGSQSYIVNVLAALTGSGTAESPYLISDATDWTTFVNNVAIGNSYSGQHVRLNANISVTTPVGDASHPFSGTFLGNDKTLNITLSGINAQGAAPFVRAVGATIKNLTVTGSVTTVSGGNGRHASGLVGMAGDGTLTISGVTVSVAISGSTDYVGGFVGHAQTATVNISNSMFNGSIAINGGHAACFNGWSGKSVNVTGSLVAATTLSGPSFVDFVENTSNATISVTGSYSLASLNFGVRQGTKVYATAGDAPSDGIYGPITAIDGNTYYAPVTISGIKSFYLYTGEEISITPVVKSANGTVLTKGTHYDYTFSPSPVMEIGTYTATFTGMGTCSGTKTVNFTVGDGSFMVGEYAVKLPYNVTSPAGVSAETAVTEVTDQTTWNAGWYVVNTDVTISSRITCSGAVNLILADGATLTAPKGITVTGSNSLTIWGQGAGTGTLTINGCDRMNAGIGGGDSQSGDNITINGGTINATGGIHGAGIGGSYRGRGFVTINGGTVNATGGDYGAGIGGGNGSSGNIVITGGTVNAEGGYGAAGIGEGIDNVDSGGNINISDGNVRATAGRDCPNAIGNGGRTHANITITITGGCFANGDTGTNKVYGIAVATGYTVVDRGTGTYRYAVAKNITLANDDSSNGNTDIIVNNDGKMVNVTLDGRTLVRDGSWNTLCLPFALSDTDDTDGLTFTGTPLEGATVKTLLPSSNLSADGTLTLYFGDAVTAIQPGVPYIVKWDTPAADISDPVFTAVTIADADPTANAVTFPGGQFVGQFSNFAIDADNINEIVMLGANNQLGYSKNTRDLKAFRAHFLIPTEDTSNARAISSYVIDFGDESTAIRATEFTEPTEGTEAVYTLQGIRIEPSAMQRGQVYIVGGKKVVKK